MYIKGAAFDGLAIMEQVVSWYDLVGGLIALPKEAKTTRAYIMLQL